MARNSSNSILRLAIFVSILFLGFVMVIPSIAPAMSTVSGQPQGGKDVSIQSFNFPRRYVRHKGGLGYVETIEGDLGKKDATFKMIPGLAGKCASFMSVNYPNHFLRHRNFRLVLAERTDDQLFKEDATFCVVSGLAYPTWYSFEALNLPRHFIRHRNFELWLDRDDNTKLFREDATFLITTPGGGVKID